MPEDQVIANWAALAGLMCAHWNAFAADLANEPRAASWGRGASTDWNLAAERLGDAVLGACPRLLIFVQGVGGEPGAKGDGGPGKGYFWGENLVGARAAPVRLRGVEGAGGEDEVKAYIVTDGGGEIDNIALLVYCSENIPRFAVPRYIEAVEAVAKTATGKIQKETLRQAGVTNCTWDRESVGYKIARRV